MTGSSPRFLSPQKEWKNICIYFELVFELKKSLVSCRVHPHDLFASFLSFGSSALTPSHA
jgi:hypothetical protein